MAQALQFRAPKPYGTVPAAACQQMAVRIEGQAANVTRVPFQGRQGFAFWHAPQADRVIGPQAAAAAARQDPPAGAKDQAVVFTGQTFEHLDRFAAWQTPESDGMVRA